VNGSQDSATRHRKDIYSEYYNAMPSDWSSWHPGDKDSSIGDHATMLRTETHKLIIAHGHDSGELYDLANDPHESRNLWNKAEHLVTQADLLKRLTDRMAWTTDPLPERRAVW
jgi:arylsulfatase